MTFASVESVAIGTFTVILALIFLCAILAVFAKIWLWASGWPDGDPVWERVRWDAEHREGREKGWWRGRR